MGYWRRHPEFGHVALCRVPQGFSAIREADIDLVIWENAISDTLLHAIAQADSAFLPRGYYRCATGPDGRLMLMEDTVFGGLEPFLAHAPLERQLFRRLTALANYLWRLQGCDPERLLLNLRVEKWRRVKYRHPGEIFHEDSGVLRMIVPLRGARTQWLPREARAKLLQASRPHVSGAFQRRRAAPSQATQTFPLGSAALFRGSDALTGCPLVHRAPRRRGVRMLAVYNVM